MQDQEQYDRLTTVAPHLWPRALQRSKVIEEYLRIKHPSATDADHYASLLGIRRRRFYYLVKAHRNNAADTALENAKLYRLGFIKGDRARVIEEAIAKLGSDASLSRTCAEVTHLSRARNIVTPSPTAVRTRLSVARLSVPLIEGSPTLVLDHCALRLPVEQNGRIVRAVLTALLHSQSGQILGHHVHAGKPTPADATAAVVEGLQHVSAGTDSAEGLTLQFHRDQDPGWEAFERVIRGKGISLKALTSSERSAGKALRHILGLKLGRIPLEPRNTLKPAEGLASLSPMTIGEIQRVIRVLLNRRQKGLLSSGADVPLFTFSDSSKRQPPASQ